MHISADEAKSDVILAAAATLFGGFVMSLVTRLPLYPRGGGVIGLLLGVFWIFALTGLVPLLLAHYRGDRLAAFGLTGARDGWRRGLVLMLPIVALEVVRALVATGSVLPAVLGRIVGATGDSPVIGGFEPSGMQAALASLQLVALVAGALMLTTFLTVRGREGFRPVDVSMTQVLRTFGMGAAGLALLLGLVRSIGPDARPLSVLMQAVALAALVLLTDRLIPLGPTFPRGAVLAPTVVVLVSHVLATGGIFRGDLLVGLHTGALAAGTTIVIAVLIATRRWAWGIVPLIVALHWWPSCLSPLALEIGSGGC